MAPDVPIDSPGRGVYRPGKTALSPLTRSSTVTIAPENIEVFVLGDPDTPTQRAAWAFLFISLPGRR